MIIFVTIANVRQPSIMSVESHSEILRGDLVLSKEETVDVRHTNYHCGRFENLSLWFNCSKISNAWAEFRE